MIAPLRYIVLAASLVAAVYGEDFTLKKTFEVKDRNDVPVLVISDVKMFRQSAISKDVIPTFQAGVKNVSGEDLAPLPIKVTVRKKDASTTEFSFTVNGMCGVCDFHKDATFNASHDIYQPWPYTLENFESVGFSLPDPWQSPEDRRLAAKAQASRQKRLAAEQKRKQAEEDAKGAEEKRKIRTACTAIYQGTADKKIKDLTVREEQQVRACQALRLYPPQ